MLTALFLCSSFLLGHIILAHTRFCILCANAVLQKTVGCGTLVLEFYAFLQKGEGACVCQP